MLSEKKKKPTNTINLEQHELLEYAQKRITQKKGVFTHLILFSIGSVFLFLINKVFKYAEAYDWALWAFLAWAFLLLLHTFNVFVKQKFMGQDWERRQREHLVSLQKARIAEMQKEVETDLPLSNANKKEDL